MDDWVLVLIGKRDEDLEKRGVVFIDYMPRINYLANISKANLGINPLVVNDKTKISSQNRVFEYAKLGVQVISTKTPLLEENFNQKIIWFNPDESVEKLVDILTNIENFPTGKELMEYSKQFSWETDFKEIIRIYNDLKK